MDCKVSPKFHALLHGGDYNPDQWLDRPDILEADIKLMREAGVNCVSLAIFAWATLEPSEGEYRFEWLDKLIDSLYDAGIYTILATPSAARPVWMAHKYPEVLRMDSDRTPMFMGGRHNHCYTSPEYRRLVTKIDTLLAQRYAAHPAVIMWHISNEFSGDCHCELCRRAFVDWLKTRYSSLDELNSKWWTSFWSHTYTEWEQIEPPSRKGEGNVHGLNLDWRRFVTHQTGEFIKTERDAVLSVTEKLPVTINMMTFFSGLNYDALAELIDVASWDTYPRWHYGDDIATAVSMCFYHDYMRCLKNRPFLLMESTPSTTNWMHVSKLKRPGMHMLSSMSAIAHGSNSVQYFQWRKGRGGSEKYHGAVVDHYGGSDTRVFRDVAAVGTSLSRIDAVKDTLNKASVAIIYDMENKWMIEDSKGPRNGGINYDATLLAHYKPFWSRGVDVDVISMKRPLDGYKLVIAPMAYTTAAGFDEKARAYVEGGGTLVTTYMCGYADENDLCHMGGFPAGAWGATLGIWAEEIDALPDGVTVPVIYDGQVYKARELCELSHLRGAEELAVYDGEFYKGMPALTVNSIGGGKAYYEAARMDDAFLDSFLSTLMKETGIKTYELPDGVTLSTRTGESDYLFVQNYNEYECRVELGGTYENVENGEHVGAVLCLPPYGVLVLRSC